MAHSGSHVWDAENANKPNRFGALDATRHVVLRFVSNFPRLAGVHDQPLWHEWKSMLEPVLTAGQRLTAMSAAPSHA